ncbi:MAG: hypothetical protein DHS80DRAFT_25471 [Piptocephalis tieghemiana]|nr:MAG: hypothetical protein DHS80DRAFT_25471 [Piptocephalis tieghemiana]
MSPTFHEMKRRRVDTSPTMASSSASSSSSPSSSSGSIPSTPASIPSSIPATNPSMDKSSLPPPSRPSHPPPPPPPPPHPHPHPPRTMPGRPPESHPSTPPPHPPPSFHHRASTPMWEVVWKDHQASPSFRLSLPLSSISISSSPSSSSSSFSPSPHLSSSSLPSLLPLPPSAFPASGFPSPPHQSSRLLHLPQEVLHLILHFLPSSSLFSLARTCRALQGPALLHLYRHPEPHRLKGLYDLLRTLSLHPDKASSLQGLSFTRLNEPSRADRSLTHLLRCLPRLHPNLRSLNLAFCPGIVNLDLIRLAIPLPLPSLRFLDISGSGRSNHVLAALPKLAPNLRGLNLSWNFHISDQGIQSLVRGCRDLRVIEAAATAITVQGLDMLLSGLPHIRAISLAMNETLHRPGYGESNAQALTDLLHRYRPLSSSSHPCTTGHQTLTSLEWLGVARVSGLDESWVRQSSSFSLLKWEVEAPWSLMTDPCHRIP